MKLKEWKELPARTKLHLAPFNSSGIYGTHDMEVVENGKGDRKMA